ncbi:MAG: purine-nucleoside phosphorylase [Bacilli bacterium]
MATPHIESTDIEIEKNVIMPGDPLRAKFIAEHYLTSVKQINQVRNILGYSGKYKGMPITVLASGMGIPSMGIYAYELYKFYNVENIIRVGSCGSYVKELNLFDLVLVNNSISESNFGLSFCNKDTKIIASSPVLNEQIIKTASSLNKKITLGNIFCSEAFYNEGGYVSPLKELHHCLGVEMETFSLFHIASKLGKQASSILTVSDSFITNEVTTSEMREKSFTEMIILALESLEQLYYNK